MKVKAISIALVLVVVAAGCGSKKSASSAAGNTTTTAAPASNSGGSGAGTTTTTSSTTGGSGSTSFASIANCAQLEGIGRKFSQAMAASSGNGKSSLSNVANVYKELASAAPAAIRSDFETIATAFQGYTGALAKAGYTPGKVPTASQIAALTAASKSFSTPKLQAAEQHLAAWGSKNCHG
jgi:hypothetical protein